MKTKLFLSAFIAVLFSISLFSQEVDTSYLFRGKVYEVETEIPLLGVNVYDAANPTQGTTTDKNGSYKLPIQKLPAKIVYSFVGYESDTILFDNPNRRYKRVYMQPDIFILPKIEITAKLILERLSDKLISIRDFLMLENDKILYLKKEGEILGWAMILATLDGYVLDTFNLKKNDIFAPKSLHRSCLGSIHLITKYGAYQLGTQENEIVVEDTYSSNKFDRLIRPCVASSDEYFYIKKAWNGGLTAKFELVERGGDFRRDFKIVSNEEQVERYQEDAYYAALYEEMEGSVFASNDSKLKNTFRQFQLELSFRNRFFHKGLDIPLFQMGDSLLIFNYYDNEINFFDEEGIEDHDRMVNIDFHLNKKWDEVIFDEATQKVYAVFENKKGKYIAEIDLETGDTHKPLHFDCMFVRKIVVHDNFLYLLHGNAHERNWVLYKVKF